MATEFDEEVMSGGAGGASHSETSSLASAEAAVAGLKPIEMGKDAAAFRDYEGDKGGAQLDRVRMHYAAMRRNQCVAFVEKMEEKWLSFDKAKMTIWEAFEAMEDFVDASDPDTTAPNLEHMLQTAEGLRKAGHPRWLQLTGLLHDLGKIMYRWGEVEDGQDGFTETGPQWALGGDTWVVGAPLPDDAMVFPEMNAFNPDREHPVYGHGTGMYEPHCGLAKLKFAWGHDEYMARMLEHNAPSFPPLGLAVIRYHSCYPLHNKGAYKELLAPGDEDILTWVRIFQHHDLYTKADAAPNLEELKPYYQELIDEFCPGVMSW